tara:strand:- start:367 stop:810 length:444 start_codon:yes stop_codon:yes gene_type:complete
MVFVGLKYNRDLFASALFLTIGCFSYAQDRSEGLLQEMELQHNFFDAIRFRSDLNFNSNKRILYTTMEDIEAFNKKYKDSEMSLEYVIRNQLHTAIFLNQKKNYLQSLDGSEFRLSQNSTAEELTNQVVSLIGRMYYGADEVKALFH